MAPPFVSVFGDARHPGWWVLGGIIVFIAFIFTGIRYVVSDGGIVVRIWFIRLGRIEIADIRSVGRSYNPISSPAGSLKRLRLSFWKKSDPDALISPADERRFIEALKAVNPDIEVNLPKRRGLFDRIWRIWDWDI
jgi:hypothetical protein